MSHEVLFIAALIVLTLLAVMVAVATLFRKAGPHEAMIVYGLRGTRIVIGKGTLIFPMIESFRQLSLQFFFFYVYFFFFGLFFFFCFFF